MASPSNRAQEEKTREADKACPSKTSTASRIADAVEIEIIQGRFQPRESLTESSLSERFGVSHIPVREALRILESRGYLVSAPFQGWKIKEFTLDEVKEVILVRAHLVALATQLACNRLTERHVTHLQALVKEMAEAAEARNVKDYFRLNMLFHDQIDVIGANQTLIRILRSLNNITLRYRFAALNLPGRLKDSLREHVRMLQAFKRRDALAAAEAARASALTSGQLVIDHLFTHYP
jgi:DNA-binding GntR family transcriptional regulator